MEEPYSHKAPLNATIADVLLDFARGLYVYIIVSHPTGIQVRSSFSQFITAPASTVGSSRSDVLVW